tara:strand:- start:29 stop:175 length:147 start_codon:yes stop_codon:yes gene_type:complete
VKILVVKVVFLCTFSIKGQTVEELPTALPSSLIGLSIYGHAYPVFLKR